MGHLKSSSTLSQVEKVNNPQLLDMLESFRRALEEENGFEYWEDVVVTTPSSANTEFAVYCTKLNKVPRYYLVIKKSAAVDVYSGSTNAINNRIFLKASVANVVITVRVFK